MAPFMQLDNEFFGGCRNQLDLATCRIVARRVTSGSRRCLCVRNLTLNQGQHIHKIKS